MNWVWVKVRGNVRVRVRVRELALMIRVRVKGGLEYYASESPHKDRSLGMCACARACVSRMGVGIVHHTDVSSHITPLAAPLSAAYGST